MDFGILPRLVSSKHVGFLLALFVLLCNFHHASMAATTATEFRIVADPQNVTTRLNGNVFLHCQYNDLVNCVWHRNGKPIKVIKNYHYVTSADGIGTTDCSIRIQPVKEVDFGAWQCEVTVANGNVARSRVAFITNKSA